MTLTSKILYLTIFVFLIAKCTVKIEETNESQTLKIDYYILDGLTGELHGIDYKSFFKHEGLILPTSDSIAVKVYVNGLDYGTINNDIILERLGNYAEENIN